MGTGEAAIRLARPADGERCNQFYNAYYGLARTTRQWEWEFCRVVAPDGTLPFAIAEVDGEIVGSQALILIDLIDRNGPYRTAKSEETLVAPQMRGQNLFHRLYEPLLAFAADAGVASIWGFTPAEKAFVREGFDAPARTAQLLRVFTGAAAAKLRSSAPAPAWRRPVEAVAAVSLAAYAGLRSAVSGRSVGPAVPLTTLTAAPDWADAVSAAFVAEWGGTTMHRSRAYLDWRLFANPYIQPIVVAADVAGAPVGWIAFGLGADGIAAIVDMVAVSPPSGAVPVETVVRALLEAATARCRDMGAAALRCWDVTDHPFARLVRTTAERTGWVRLSRGHLMVIKHLAAGSAHPDAGPIDRWYVTRLFTEGVSP